MTITKIAFIHIEMLLLKFIIQLHCFSSNYAINAVYNNYVNPVHVKWGGRPIFPIYDAIADRRSR